MNRELQGWKEIADYLRVTERTTQNWARHRHLPVHHLPGPKGRVFASTDEIDSWKLTVPATPVQSRFGESIAVSLSGDQVSMVRPLMSRFASLQEFVTLAVDHYIRVTEDGMMVRSRR